MSVDIIFQSKGDKGIIETMYKMRELILKTDTNRIVKTKAKEIIANISPTDELGQIRAIFNWVRNNVKYVRDYQGIEELTSPDIIINDINNKRNTYSSDCDDMAMLLCALLRSVGFRTRIEVIALKNDKAYDHARCAVFSQTLNRWLPLEATSPTKDIGDGFHSKRVPLGLDI